jgi:hypothetical protein
MSREAITDDVLMHQPKHLLGRFTKEDGFRDRTTGVSVTTSLVARYLACQVNKRFDAADAFPRRIEWMLSYLCQSLGHVHERRGECLHTLCRAMAQMMGVGKIRALFWDEVRAAMYIPENSPSTVSPSLLEKIRAARAFRADELLLQLFSQTRRCFDLENFDPLKVAVSMENDNM